MKKYLFFILGLLTAFVADGARFYVVPGGAGKRNGSSWNDGFAKLQSAINAASAKDEIWVKAGTYKQGTELEVKKSLSIYGGFSGKETKLDQRNYISNKTILSGNSSYRVISISADCTLDGFTISDGKAPSTNSTTSGGLPESEASAGGIFIKKNASSPVVIINNCIFKNNKARPSGTYSDGFGYGYAGAIFISKSNTTLNNCSFSGNYAETSGGAIYATNCSKIKISHCFFDGSNIAKVGQAIYHNPDNTDYVSDLTIASSTFKHDCSYEDASKAAYEIYSMGPTYSSRSILNFYNCTFYSSKSCDKKFINTQYTKGTISHCTFVRSNIYIPNDSLPLQNSIVSGGDIYINEKIYNSIIKAKISKSNSLINCSDSDPLLLALKDYGGLVKTIAVPKNSPAINFCDKIKTSYLDYDARGFSRKTKTTAGAYEYIEPKIITQPKEQTVYVNTNALISISASSGTGSLIYRWQKYKEKWIDIEGATSATLNFENIQMSSSGKYRCIVSNLADGLSVTSKEVVLTVKYPPFSQAELSANHITIVDGGYGRLEVSSDAVDPSYKWYYSANTGIDWVEIENSNSSVLEFKASSSMNRYQYKCVVTDGGGTSVESNKAVLIINSSAIVISQDIGDAMGFIGKETVLSVSANSSSTLGYQWQVSTDNGATWVDIKDATSSSLSLIPEDYELSGNLYRLKIDNGGGFIYSNVSTFTVFKNVEITEQPKDLIVWNAKNAEFEVSTTGDGIIKYQWQILVGEEWRDVENAASAKFFLENVSTEMDGNKYRCAVSNEGTVVLYSNEATLTVYKTLEITFQPQEIWAFAGDSATFTVEVDAQGDVEYRWQEFIGGEWVDLENAALSEYQIPSMEDSFDGRKFRVLITNGGDVFASNEVSLKLATPVEITTQPQNIKLAYMGKMAVFSVEAVGYKPQFKWYVSGNYGTDEALEIDGATSNTLSISVDSDLVLENVYFCKITNDKSEKYSNLVYVEDIRTLSGYQSWALDNGLDVDASASAVSHGDGITNIEKYAFGLDASKATSYGANGNFKHSVENGVASFQFPVRKDASDISVKLMMSNDMSNWEEADAVSIGESGEFNLFNYSAPVPVNGKLFFKLKVLEK